MVKEVLLSFVGAQDPHSLKGGGPSPGPIVTLAAERRFDKVVLFHTRDEDSGRRARDTASVLVAAGGGTCSSIVPLPIDDPSSHPQILEALRAWWGGYKEEGAVEYFISVASGTPAMHACWLLLAAADEIHANVLYIRDRRHVCESLPLVGEINPRAPVFPAVGSRRSLAEVADTSTFRESELAASVGLAGETPVFRRTLELAMKYGSSEHPVLLTGETGTGKERFARLLHGASKRSHGPFVPINCGALAAGLIESELFGHVKGAFTGADRDKKGAFEEANGGTLFLDEVGDMPLEMQVKLLRVLQERKIRHVGGQEISVDVRIVAATHLDLLAAQRQGAFRQDLFNRLNVLPLQLPALRDRREDIPLIAFALLEKENRANGGRKKFTSRAIEKLIGHAWPGNVRELENVIKRGVVLAEGERIEADDLIVSADVLEGQKVPLPALGGGFSVEEFINDYRYRIYVEAMRQAGGNRSKAGRLVGRSSTAIVNYLEKHGKIVPDR